jgi:glycerol-3-phosphate dehydrogenase
MFGGGGFTIRPRKGELIVFDKLARPLLSSIILPVPTARTKGVLVAPTVFGNVLLGPTAEDVHDRSDTATSAPGLAALLAAGRRILPGLEDEEVTATYAGLRAATEHPDYQVGADGRYVRVAGIRSTGLTASLGLAEHVAGLLGETGLALKPRAGAEQAALRLPYLGETGRRPYQDAERIAADPAYGEIACHCERATRGEIRDALTSDIPPAGLDGLRRRTRAMNGRCQAFYCGEGVSAMFREATAARGAEGHRGR